ncbi:mitochondrial ribosomal protein MRP51 [Tricharina praecox]|uniref:mitochondrial ribosomal protein MRP51 n=1 Tax=Tricharina praecox TaxID=43433 RepID=UPI00221FF43F|nr:mitochondrial ribosomal protein MRP51 [Tricharina praecox]KAI5858467.1 mitochondrial ribosomal protein MRP51 [Tricharina praecox]
MSTKTLSPAAHLLRNSRLMAMPAPVPPPPSLSITTPPPAPYPTLQAITTPRSSAFRGDWGLKRGLPLSTSAKSIYMRYGALDTIEHMTTFESAHDDVYTLRKWQELDVALYPPVSEHDYDMDSRTFDPRNTVFDEVKPEAYKWRYEGPFVKGMAPKDLREYIKKEIVPRKDEFYDFVAKRQRVDKIKRKHMMAGEVVSPAQIEKEAEGLEIEKVDIMKIRADHPYLERLVIDFLDIPINKPPSTHPSAGLHYTRSNAYAYNDPELGPQQAKKEVPGRRLGWQPATGQVAGIAGVVAKVQRNSMRTTPRNEDRFPVHKYRPVKAGIDSKGKIQLAVDQVVPPSELYGSTGFRFLANRRIAAQTDAATRQRKNDTDAIMERLLNPSMASR